MVRGWLLERLVPWNGDRLAGHARTFAARRRRCAMSLLTPPTAMPVDPCPVGPRPGISFRHLRRARDDRSVAAPHLRHEEADPSPSCLFRGARRLSRPRLPPPTLDVFEPRTMTAVVIAAALLSSSGMMCRPAMLRYRMQSGIPDRLPAEMRDIAVMG